MPKDLARFDHHPDPAIDFCVEVEELQSIAWDRAHGLSNPDDAELEERVAFAMQFRVGGDEGAVNAKGLLRSISRSIRP